MRCYFNIVLWNIFLAVASDRSDNNGCLTPDVRVGECQLASECETIPFLRNVTKTLQQREYLRKSICGFEGTMSKICCPLLSSVPTVIQPAIQPVTTTNVTQPTPSTPGRVAGKCLPTALPPDPNSQCCGHQDVMSTRILGGQETEIDQYPWLVLLEYRDIDTNSIDTKCGGSLISGRYVLTAAQCVDAGRTNMPESVRLGEYDTLNDTDCVFEVCNDGPTSIPIQEIIVHTKFSPGRYPRDDIGLLRLSKMAIFSDFIQPICLPSATATVPRYLFVAGWGATSSGPRSSVKLHVRLPFVNLTTCNPYYHYQLSQDQICAGGEIGRDACTGDAGGPLMHYTRYHYEVLGIVSYGSKPCGFDQPGVYTDVRKYVGWIRVNMHE